MLNFPILKKNEGCNPWFEGIYVAWRKAWSVLLNSRDSAFFFFFDIPAAHVQSQYISRSGTLFPRTWRRFVIEQAPWSDTALLRKYTTNTDIPIDLLSALLRLSFSYAMCIYVLVSHLVVWVFSKCTGPSRVHLVWEIIKCMCAGFVFSCCSLRQDPLEAILVIFGRRALIFFCLKALGKNEKWCHFCAHAQWWSPWRRKNVEKGHLAPSNLTFLIIAIDRNGFRRMKEEGLIYQTLPRIF